MINLILNISVSMLFALLICTPNHIYAQEEAETKKHEISIALGHAQVAKGIEQGDKKWLALPTWALDYKFNLNNKWSLSWQNDIILSDFEVESNERKKTFTRTHPLASIAAIGFSPVEWLCVYAGGGAEIAKEENFGVVRIGVEPIWEIRDNWELILSTNYDMKLNAYDSFGIALGVCCLF